MSIEDLEEYLLSEDLPDGALLMSGLDGFLTGIAVSPKPVPESEWMPQIWGGAMPPLALMPGTAWVVDAIRAHGAMIRLIVETAPETLTPILETDNDDELLPEIWAEGFMRAVYLRGQDWKPLLDNDAGWATLLPIALFADDRGPAGKLPKSARRKRDELRGKAEEVFRSAAAGLRAFWQGQARR